MRAFLLSRILIGWNYTIFKPIEFETFKPHRSGGFIISLFGDAMSQNNIDNEILATEQELKHLGSCTTKGLTDEEIAQQDERFFLAIAKLEWLKGRRDVRVFEWKPVKV
jgi:hypothetical protein